VLLASVNPQMNALRRALRDGQVGNRYIVTVPGRGYNFVAPVRREDATRAAPTPAAPSTTPCNLPLAATRMINRDDAVVAFGDQHSRTRLMAIVGAGGVGKITVALAVAERITVSHEPSVWLVDLARLADQHLVSSAVATALGQELRTEKPLRLVLYIQNASDFIAPMEAVKDDDAEKVILDSSKLTATATKGL
jgi:hypothetical protein